MNSEIVAALIGGACVVIAALISKGIWKRSERRKAVVFYSRKSELPSYQESLVLAETEVCLLCIHAMGFIRANEPQLKDMLQRGLRIRVLEMAFEIDGKLNPEIERFGRLTRHPKVLEDIKSSRATTEQFIEDVRDKCGKQTAARLEIREYRTFPSALYLMVDMRSSRGFSIVEPVLPYLTTGERPTFRVSVDKDKLLERLGDSFEAIWEVAKPMGSSSAPPRVSAPQTIVGEGA